MSGWLCLGEGLVGRISPGEKSTMSRCDIVPGTATCGCVHVSATVCLYSTLRFLCVCMYTHQEGIYTA